LGGESDSSGDNEEGEIGYPGEGKRRAIPRRRKTERRIAGNKKVRGSGVETSSSRLMGQGTPGTKIWDEIGNYEGAYFSE